MLLRQTTQLMIALFFFFGAVERQIGFTSFDKWLTFSPAKNDLESAAAAAAEGVPPGTASSAESEFYAQAARRLQMVSGRHESPRYVLIVFFYSTRYDSNQPAINITGGHSK